MKAFALAVSLNALFACVVMPSAALAQDAKAVEVTPFVALGSQGSAPVGAAISFPITANTSIEAEVGYRRGEGNINALSSSANLIYALPRIGRTTPYLAAGAGLAEFGAPIVGPNGGIVATQPLVGFVVNAGGGIKVPVDDSWGMRTDARWFKSFGRHASEEWRVAQGISFDVGKR